MLLEKIIFGGIIFVIIALVALLVFIAIEQDEQQTALKDETETKYQECLKTENKYTCEAYKNSVYAKISADNAKTSAAIAATMGGVAIGMGIGRK